MAELPEGEFKDLECGDSHVGNATSGDNMSCPRPQGVLESCYSHDEQDEGVGSTRISESHSTNAMKTRIRPSESETRRLEEDSGVYNTSKPTSHGIWTDEKSSDDEIHVADSDYFPPGRTLYYVEIHEVETESSTEDWSDFDQKETQSNGEDELEMIIISSSNEEMPIRFIFHDDFDTSGESEDDSSRAFSYYSYPSKSKTSYSYKPKFDSLSTSIPTNAYVDGSISFRTLEEVTSAPSQIIDKPVNENGSALFFKNNYNQMKEAPSAELVTLKDKSSRMFGSGPTRNTDEFFELAQSHIDSDDDFHRAQEKRKHKKLNKEVEKRSETKNYIGNKSIEELVDFINSNNADKQKHEKTVSSNSKHIPGKTAKSKISKKSKVKDRKQKSVTASNSVDMTEEKVETSVFIDSPESEGEVKKGKGTLGPKTDYKFAKDRKSVNKIMKKEIIKKKYLKDDTKRVVNSVNDSDEVTEKKPDPDKECDNLKDTYKLQKSLEKRIDSEVNSVQKKENIKVQKKEKTQRSVTASNLLGKTVEKVKDSTNIDALVLENIGLKYVRNPRAKSDYSFAAVRSNGIITEEEFIEKLSLKEDIRKVVNSDSGTVGLTYKT